MCRAPICLVDIKAIIVVYFICGKCLLRLNVTNYTKLVTKHQRGYFCISSGPALVFQLLKHIFRPKSGDWNSIQDENIGLPTLNKIITMQKNTKYQWYLPYFLPTLSPCSSRVMIINWHLSMFPLNIHYTVFKSFYQKKAQKNTEKYP